MTHGKRSSGRRRAAWGRAICRRRTSAPRARRAGHAQVFYLLDRPVHRGEHARAKPLQYLARVSEYYRATFGADAGYRGVLASNPIHSDYQTSYPRIEPYTLDQLAGAIPKGWRTPRVPTTAEGRNVSLFLELCKLSLRCSDDGLLTWARTLNSEFPDPLPDAEVRGVWRSVCGYRVKWRSQGHQQGWLWRQAARGRKGGLIGGRRSGEVRRAGTPLEHDRTPWVDLGVSRATWYRRFRGAKTDGERLGAKV